MTDTITDNTEAEVISTEEMTPEMLRAVEMAEELRAHCIEHNLIDGIFSGVVVDGGSYGTAMFDQGFQRAIDWLTEAQRMSKEMRAANQGGVEDADTDS